MLRTEMWGSISLPNFHGAPSQFPESLMPVCISLPHGLGAPPGGPESHLSLMPLLLPGTDPESLQGVFVE